jgi:hypothetical protein
VFLAKIENDSSRPEGRGMYPLANQKNIIVNCNALFTQNSIQADCNLSACRTSNTCEPLRPRLKRSRIIAPVQRIVLGKARNYKNLEDTNKDKLLLIGKNLLGIQTLIKSENTSLGI